MGQRVAGVVGVGRTRGQRDARDRLPGQRINHRHPGQRDIAGVGHRNCVIQYIAYRIGQRIAVTTGHIDEHLVDSDLRIIDQRCHSACRRRSGLVTGSSCRIVDIVIGACLAATVKIGLGDCILFVEGVRLTGCKRTDWYHGSGQRVGCHDSG